MKRFSENMQQMYWRTPMPKFDPRPGTHDPSTYIQDTGPRTREPRTQDPKVWNPGTFNFFIELQNKTLKSKKQLEK